MTSRTALYPGSFDPMTVGHLDVLTQSMRLFDRVIVAIGVHPGKTPLFSFAEREELIRAAAQEIAGHLSGDLDVVAFDGLVIDAAATHGAAVLIRGIRNGSDLDYEMQMAGMNGKMAPELVTMFLPAQPEFRPITATLVRQIARMGGDVSPFVPKVVAEALKMKFA